MKKSLLYIGRGRPTPAMLWQDLAVSGYQVTVVNTQKLALELVVSSPPAVAVVDGTTSRLSGPNACRTLRRCLPNLPLILIVDPLEKAPASLADALLPKPFTVRRFIHCVETVLQGSETLRVGSLMLDIRTRTVVGPKGVQRLNPKEFALLELFMHNPGRILSRRELMLNVWQTDYLGDTRTLDVHMRWLREKIELDPSHPRLLLTRRSAGYQLLIPVSLPATMQALA